MIINQIGIQEVLFKLESQITCFVSYLTKGSWKIKLLMHLISKDVSIGLHFFQHSLNSCKSLHSRKSFVLGELSFARMPSRQYCLKVNKVPEATNDVDALTFPHKTDGNTPDGPDKTITQPKNVLPDATNPLSPDATKDNMDEPKHSVDESASRNSVDEKRVKGMFKTKTITIRRSKDPRTFKCSVCSTRASTLKELNTHFIQNHRNVACDMCGKLFLTPSSLRKHHYSHIEESEQFQCHTCDKRFPFKSQLKSHRHMHSRTRYYSCASANCECSFRHPGDLAAHARSHGKPFNCAHCLYSNTDIRNLCSHMRVHSWDAPFTCKMCGQKFVHSNQLVRHKLKCAKNLLKQDDWHYQKEHLFNEFLY